MPTSRLVLINLAFHLAAVLGYDYGAINHGAEPYVVAMFNNASIGPDGKASSGPFSTHLLTRMDD